MAERSRAATGRNVLARAIKSFSVNPQWMAMQQNVTAKTSEIVTRTHREISDIIRRTFEFRQAVQDDLGRKWSNAILELTDVRDPVTGETWKVAAGSNYYWRRGDTVVGLDTYVRPNIDFTPLEEW